jgi:5-methylcytosine-specific restriction protein B
MVKDIEIDKLFDTINQRIEFLIDKDHAIGHSYFLKDYFKKDPTITNLALIFKKEIIPLLMEYFYGDFEKIQLVLGDNTEWKPVSHERFIKKKRALQKSLFGKDEVVDGYDEKTLYEMTDLSDLKQDSLVTLFKSVYTKPKTD